MDFDLAKFRAEKGISLHEISTKLNIPEKFLLAIEELNFDELPAPIFAKSQIKKYCSFYDLEPSIILEKYEKFLKEKIPNAIGLSVPGMPLGSPGMEFGDRKMTYDVLILFKDGSSEVFATVSK